MFFKDISYGAHERNILDLAIPESAGRNDGMILIIHGGGWNSCDKSAHDKDVEFWSSLGFITATMNYRYVSAEIHIPDLLDDITKALGFIKEKCAENGHNVEKAMLMGGSAGAHLCMMYAFTRFEEAPIKPALIMDNCGPVDFTKPDFLIGINGQFEDYKYGVISDCVGRKITKENIVSEESRKALLEYSPICFVNENTVPIILGHGKLDDIVPFNQCEQLIEKLNSFGIENELIIYENSGHALDKDPDSVEKANEICRKYAEKILKNKD